jgi:hypothetical protein
MGLDMYLVGKTSDGTNKELGYWRKHPDLHGFIVNEFGGGIDECQQIDLNEECLKQILLAVENGNRYSNHRRCNLLAPRKSRWLSFLSGILVTPLDIITIK